VQQLRGHYKLQLLFPLTIQQYDPQLNHWSGATSGFRSLHVQFPHLDWLLDASILLTSLDCLLLIFLTSCIDVRARVGGKRERKLLRKGGGR
jgi:hypothetical protein